MSDFFDRLKGAASKYIGGKPQPAQEPHPADYVAQVGKIRSDLGLEPEVRDMGELGDYTPSDDVSPDEAGRRERVLAAQEADEFRSDQTEKVAALSPVARWAVSKLAPVAWKAEEEVAKPHPSLTIRPMSEERQAWAKKNLPAAILRLGGETTAEEDEADAREARLEQLKGFIRESEYLKDVKDVGELRGRLKKLGLDKTGKE